MDNWKSHAMMALGDALIREHASKRPANSNEHTEWELVPGGIRPYRREAVDCAGSAPDSGNSCYNRPVWVIEDFDGHTPTCSSCLGKVLNKLLAKYDNNSEVSMYFHPYKGA